MKWKGTHGLVSEFESWLCYLLVCKLGSLFLHLVLFSTINWELWFFSPSLFHRLLGVFMKEYQAPSPIWFAGSSLISGLAECGIFMSLWARAAFSRLLYKGYNPIHNSFQIVFLQVLYVPSTNISYLPTICQGQLSEELIAGNTLTKNTGCYPSANCE